MHRACTRMETDAQTCTEHVHVCTSMHTPREHAHTRTHMHRACTCTHIHAQSMHMHAHTHTEHAHACTQTHRACTQHAYMHTARTQHAYMHTAGTQHAYMHTAGTQHAEHTRVRAPLHTHTQEQPLPPQGHAWPLRIHTHVKSHPWARHPAAPCRGPLVPPPAEGPAMAPRGARRRGRCLLPDSCFFSGISLIAAGGGTGGAGGKRLLSRERGGQDFILHNGANSGKIWKRAAVNQPPSSAPPSSCSAGSSGGRIRTPQHPGEWAPR